MWSIEHKSGILRNQRNNGVITYSIYSDILLKIKDPSSDAQYYTIFYST